LREAFDATLLASTNGQRRAAPAFAGRRKTEEKQMKSRFFHCSAVALLAAMAFAPTAALSKYVCDNPSSPVDKRACAKAAEGAAALRNFVERTRMIWHLDIWDYVRPEQPSASTSAAAKPAR
jgi:hypothetical protein